MSDKIFRIYSRRNFVAPSPQNGICKTVSVLLVITLQEPDQWFDPPSKIYEKCENACNLLRTINLNQGKKNVCHYFLGII